MAEPTDLHDMPVHTGAVGAFQVGEDQVVAILLDLGMVTTDALVVEPEEVSFFAANRERHGQVAEEPAFIDAVHDLKGHLDGGTG